MPRKKHINRVVGQLYKKHRDPVNRQKSFHYDLAEAERILAESVKASAISTSSPTGKCFDCDKPVTGERKLCGVCLNKRDEERRKQ